MFPPRTLALAGFSALALTLGAGPALAQPGDAQSRQVSLTRIDLSTAHGAEAAYRLISDAARDACRSENRFGAGYERGLRTCIADTVERAVDQLDAPRLTALHEARNEPTRLASTRLRGAS